MPDRDDWARAYAIQSRSDFRVYQMLSLRPEIEKCHSLHYLQMACEKIAKAYRFRDTATGETHLTTEHVAFSRFVENYLRSRQMKARYSGREEQLRQILRLSRKLAREIEKLAPAVAAEAYPVNAEYPWASGKQIVIPCEYSYPNLSLLTAEGGRRFVRLVEIAIKDFSDIHIT